MRYLVLALLFGCGCTLDGDGEDVIPPTPSGCITDVASGDHAFSCGGLAVDARIPSACQAPGCGLILVLHGDTGNGLLMDAHIRMRELGAQHGYIVVAPTGPLFGGSYPGSTWYETNDATLVDIVQQFAAVFRVDAKKIHVTGFSRGGFVTWRMLCDHADLFASAAPSGAGFTFDEATCFHAARAPARNIPFIFLMGRADDTVGYTSMVNIRNAATTSYGASGPTVLDQDASYTHNRWTSSDGAVIETFDHAYEIVADGSSGSLKGHCIAGSTTDPYAPQYAIPCKPPNSFVWGEQVMSFFRAHPKP